MQDKCIIRRHGFQVVKVQRLDSGVVGKLGMRELLAWTRPLALVALYKLHQTRLSERINVTAENLINHAWTEQHIAVLGNLNITA